MKNFDVLWTIIAENDLNFIVDYIAIENALLILKEIKEKTKISFHNLNVAVLFQNLNLKVYYNIVN